MAEKLGISRSAEMTPASATETISDSAKDIYNPVWQRLPVQRKLSVGAADDPLEHEADAMADKVMRMPEPSFIQRKCSHCEDEEAQRKPLASFIQKKTDGGGTGTVSNSVHNRLQATRGGGSAMPATTKSFMESRFGADFSNVNIHQGEEAANLSNELSAKAFTVGNDIYFNKGEFSPESSGGRHLLAHELTHTIQQGAVIRRKDAGTPAQANAAPVPAAPTAAAIPAAPVLSDSVIEVVADSVREATKGWGTDEEGVYRALEQLQQNQADIDRTDIVYKRKYGETLESVIRDEMSGKELQFALELINIKKGAGLIKQLAKTDAEFELAAERLHSAMAGLGTDEEEVYAVLLPFRGHASELAKIRKVYKTKYNQDLDEELASEFSGSEKEYAKYQMDEYKYVDLQAVEVLEFIRAEAQKRAANPPSIDATTPLYVRLRDYYLKDYLANPTEATGRQAIDKIGRPMQGRYVNGRIRITPLGLPERAEESPWEEKAIGWLSHQQVPPLPPKLKALPIFQNINSLPSELGAATDILTKENWDKLKTIGVPQLIGPDNFDRYNFDNDVLGGGRNISQLMHWATGVKYSAQTEDAMRELFLAYEMFHLEGWDVFGTDSLNDMLAEDEGRQLGVELAKGAGGAIKSTADLLPFLNQSFMKSRAWLGTLLKMRRSELDGWILAKEQKKAVIHWDQDDQQVLWNSPTIYQMLASGQSVSDVEKSRLVGLQIETYALLFEADLWEKANGPIKVTELEKALVEGKLNDMLAIFALKEKGKFSTIGDIGLVKGASNDLGKIGAGDVSITQLK